MAVNGKEIKQRIKSVKNTKKITKAMEMVSAAKMRKAIQSVLGTRTYAMLARNLMKRLGGTPGMSSPLMEVRPVSKVLVIMISSNRGLCGSFNANLFKNIAPLLKEKKHTLTTGATSDIEIEIIGVGKKSAHFAKRYGFSLVAAYDAINDNPSVEEISPIVSTAITAFRAKRYDAVFTAFTEFKSSLVQIPRMMKVLPISAEHAELLHLDTGESVGVDSDDTDVYVFEPNEEEVFEVILPRLVEIQLYQALLESRASEHSARMVAMKNATESAGDMIQSLTLEFNKARQAAITTEIAEISGGAAALEG